MTSKILLPFLSKCEYYTKNVRLLEDYLNTYSISIHLRHHFLPLMELKDYFFRQQENEATFLKVIFWHFFVPQKTTAVLFFFGLGASKS